MLVCTAISLRNTLESIITPYSVNVNVEDDRLKFESAANACTAVKGNVVDTVATVTLEKAIALARTELTALLKVLFIFVSSFYFV